MKINKNYLILAGTGICCFIITLISLSLLSGGVFFFSKNKPAAEQSSEVEGIGTTMGKIAQDFSLKTIEGKTVKLSDFRGKYVLFAFMSPGCGSCLFEAGNVKKAQEGKELAVILIDISLAHRENDLIKVREDFGREDWLLAFDNNFEIANLYNAKSFDTTLVLDPKGKIIYRDDGWPIRTETLIDLLE